MEKYKKQLSYSYTFGIFPTFELINSSNVNVIKILIHEKLEITKDVEKLIALAKLKNIKIEKCSKLINKICDKQSTMCVGVFEKYENKLNKNTNHIVLVNVSDMGNLGTIIRTALGFNIKDIAIISPSCDSFNPKTIRASMGAIFKINLQHFDSFEDYQNAHKQNNIYPFMLNAKTSLQTISKKLYPYSLVFGNEGSGLDEKFLNIGMPIIISHSKEIDSLNLPISTAMAIYEFSKQKGE